MLYIVMESVKNTPSCVCKREWVFFLFILETEKNCFFQTLASDKEEEFEESAWKFEFENRKIETSDERFGRAT